jgi:hypothetical protein
MSRRPPFFFFFLHSTKENLRSITTHHSVPQNKRFWCRFHLISSCFRHAVITDCTKLKRMRLRLTPWHNVHTKFREHQSWFKNKRETPYDGRHGDFIRLFSIFKKRNGPKTASVSVHACDSDNSSGTSRMNTNCTITETFYTAKLITEENLTRGV